VHWGLAGGGCPDGGVHDEDRKVRMKAIRMSKLLALHSIEH